MWPFNKGDKKECHIGYPQDYTGYAGQALLMEAVEEDMRRLKDQVEKGGHSEWFRWYIAYRNNYTEFKQKVEIAAMELAKKSIDK